MKITIKEWIIFIATAVFGLFLWYCFGYSQFKFIDLSVDKKNAVKKADDYLNLKGINTKSYRKVAVFSSDNWSDRYLQKTIGLKEEEGFIASHNYELFSWHVRYFKELQKEEYLVEVSSKSGEVLSFAHLIDDVEARLDLGKEAARKKAEEFLSDTYSLSLEKFDFHEEQVVRYDQRIDYVFSWEKKGVYIPWKKDQGGAKLLSGATISGDEVRGFYKSALDIPEKFVRFIENQLVFGQYLSGFSALTFIILLSWSVFILVKRRSDVVARICKKWYLYLFLFLIGIHFLEVFNNLDEIIAGYSTSIRLQSFIGLFFFKFSINLLFISIVFIVPGIAGESLRAENLPDNKYSSFLHYLQSSFYSRSMSSSIILGYFLFFIFLGMQSALFSFGQKYLGVWKEWVSLVQLSSAHIPFLNALIVGISASLNEEVLFRLFGISWAKKYFRNTLLAVIISAVIWGFGHTSYAVFPVWFRGLEVTAMGLVYGFVFLRYGIIPLIVAHYLFDVYWGSAAYLLGNSTIYLFAGSLGVLLLPLVFAAAAYLLNKPDQEKEIKVALSSVQVYNLAILKAFVLSKKTEGMQIDKLKEELLNNNWDPALVTLAIKDIFGC